MRSAHQMLRRIAIPMLALHATASLAASDNINNEAPLEAIWHVQSLPFEYRSLNTYYNCDSLERKVRAILELVGAHHPVILKTNCGRVPANRIHVKIVLATPVPATEENVRAVTTFDSKDELVARMRQTALPTAADIERFPAQWQMRGLTQIRDINFTHSDCDLLRGIQEQVFPKLAVRVVHKRRLNCDARASNLRRNVQYEALIATPRPMERIAPRS